MSRVGKLPVKIPQGVTVDVKPGLITIKGSKGELKERITGDVKVAVTDGNIVITPANDSQRAKAMWGTSRNLINNMVKGVAEGFVQKLEMEGVGYRAAADNQYLTLSLGFSHEIKYAIPEGIKIKCEKPTSIEIAGFNKQLVGQVAATIRALRKPEPYKGKGIRKEGERIRRKEGKKK